MAPALFLIFNHEFTDSQRADARASLGVGRAVSLPTNLQALWGAIPPDLEELAPVLNPFRQWLEKEAHAGDYVLIQGDYGATYLMVGLVRELGLIPVYATTERRASEVRLSDGSVKLTHHFSHKRFREYGR